MKNEFEVHRLNEQGMKTAHEIAYAFNELLSHVEGLCAGGDLRCLALARAKLEEACFFAKKSIAANASNQEVTP